MICIVVRLVLITLIILANSTYSFANPNTDNVILVNGAKKLADDILTWLLFLVPTVAGVMIGYHSIMKMLCDDINNITERNKKIKNVLIAAIIAFSAPAMVKIILRYFGYTG